MFKTIKNQKGITLVELLAVMVIVGIIAAISIPAIGNLIENTRKDAFISTAQNVTEAARLVVAQESKLCDDGDGCTITFGANVTGEENNTVSGDANIEKIGDVKAIVKYTGTNTTTPATYTISIVDGRYGYGVANATATGPVVTNAADAFAATRETIKVLTSAPEPSNSDAR